MSRLKCKTCGFEGDEDNRLLPTSTYLVCECEDCIKKREAEEASDTAEWIEPSLSDRERNFGSIL